MARNSKQLSGNTAYVNQILLQKTGVSVSDPTDAKSHTNKGLKNYVKYYGLLVISPRCLLFGQIYLLLISFPNLNKFDQENHSSTYNLQATPRIMVLQSQERSLIKTLL